ncbi:MAG: tetratricopeptide repeat protein [Burkholderiaceae bacterium]|nr:tetratricopeptide repeat protein [Burkholderiaceae bacterium]
MPSYATPTPLEYFAALVKSDDSFPLLEAAASIAQDAYPCLDVEQLLEDMDWLQARLAQRLAADAGMLQRLQVLNRFFFGDLGFAGTIDPDHNPENSYLHSVFHTRRGSPISLGLLWMELAQGVGLQVRGVAFPGHFMVKALLPHGQVVMDPLTGQSLSREDLMERLEPYRNHLHASTDEMPLGLYLQAAKPREIIADMLHTLEALHRTEQNWPRLIAVHDRLIVLQPHAWTHYRERGLAHAQGGHGALAVQDLQTYLAHVPGGGDIATIAERISALQAARR